jgi:hypothetical protein
LDKVLRKSASEPDLAARGESLKEASLKREKPFSCCAFSHFLHRRYKCRRRASAHILDSKIKTYRTFSLSPLYTPVSLTQRKKKKVFFKNYQVKEIFISAAL